MDGVVEGTRRRFRMTRPMFAMVGSFVIALALVVQGWGVRAQDTTTNQPRLAAFHVAAGAPAVDVLIDNVLFVSGLEFGAPTDFESLDAGDYQLQIVQSGDEGGEAIVDESVTLDDGQVYAFVVFGSGDDLESRLHNLGRPDDDDDDDDNGDAARIVGIHAAPGVDDVRIAILDDDDDDLDDLSYGGEADGENVPAGTYELDVRLDDDDDDDDDNGTATTLLSIPDVSLEAGDVYVVVITIDQDNEPRAISATTGMAAVEGPAPTVDDDDNGVVDDDDDNGTAPTTTDVTPDVDDDDDDDDS